MESNLTHWKKLTNPDYLGAYAFMPGEVKAVTIKVVGTEVVQNQTGNKEECIVARFEEDVKPLILNKTNCKTIAKLYGTDYIEEWSGKRIQLQVKKVSAFGDVVDAVRVMSVMPGDDLICEECHKIIKPAAGKSAKEIAEMAQKHVGKALCLECQKVIANSKEDKNNG